MKKMTRVLFLLCFVCLSLALSVGSALAADGDVVVNEDNFPDEKFRDYVKTLEGATDDTLTADEIADITAMYLDGKSISDLTGIEYFTSLTILTCAENALTELNVSKLVNLKILACTDNKLTELDVSILVNLEELFCADNQLTDLDVSNLKDLTILECYGNQLTTLDVSNNTKLEKLYCYNNQLTELDVSSNTALSTLYCHDNLLTTLDVSNCKVESIFRFKCSLNQLTSLNLADIEVSTPDPYEEDDIDLAKNDDYISNQSLTTPITIQYDGTNWYLDFDTSVFADSSAKISNVSNVKCWDSNDGDITSICSYAYNSGTGILSFASEPTTLDKITYDYATDISEDITDEEGVTYYKFISVSFNTTCDQINYSAIVSGGNGANEQTVVADGISSIIGTVDGDFSKFDKLLKDGQELTSKDYTAHAGSVVITLQPSYIQTLSYGTHTFTVLMIDGTATFDITVTAPATVTYPDTGDSNNLTLWVILVCVGIGGMVGFLFVGKQKPKNRK